MLIIFDKNLRKECLMRMEPRKGFTRFPYKRIVLFLLLFVLTFTGCSLKGTNLSQGRVTTETGIEESFRTLLQQTEEGKLNILFAGTKDDADCILLYTKESAIMIDTGEEQDREHIRQLIQSANRKTIDLLIITHPDKDHIGGLSSILEEVSVKEVVIPNYEVINKKYKRLLESLRGYKNQITVLKEDEERNFGEINISLYAPQKSYYEKDNNYSIATLVQFGNTKMFFAGDAKKERTKELLEENLPTVDLYKIAYHGREYKGFEQLFETLQPKDTVVTAKEAEKEVEEVLEASGTNIYDTRDQDLLFESDGTSCVIKGSSNILED